MGWKKRSYADIQLRSYFQSKRQSIEPLESRLLLSAAVGYFFVTNTNGNIVEFHVGTTTEVGNVSDGGGIAAGVAISSDGNVLIANRSTNQIQEFDSSTGKSLNTFSTSPVGDLYDMEDVNGVIYQESGSAGDNSVLKFTEDGTASGAIATGAPVGSAIAPDGSLYVVGSTGYVSRINLQSGAVTNLSTGTGFGNDVAVASDGQYVVSNQSINDLTLYSSTGSLVSTSSNVDGPDGMAFGPNGDLFVCNVNNNSVTELSYPGLAVVANYTGTDLSSPQYIAFATGASGTAANGSVVPAITAVSLPSIFVPGDVGVAKITLTNTGQTPAKGVASLKLYASPDGNLDDATPLTLPAAFAHLATALVSNQSRPLNMHFAIPATLATGDYKILAALNPVSGFTGSSVSTIPAVSADTFTEQLAFGAVGDRSKVRLAIAPGGDKVVFALSGPGTGTLSLDDFGSYTLALTGTASNTTVAISAATPVSLDGISADAAIGIINAPRINLAGALMLPGGLSALRIGDLDGAPITLGGSTPASLTLGNVTDTSIISTAPIAALTLGSFTNNSAPQSISAPLLRALSDRGDFDGNLAVASNIGSLLIRGNLTGDILAGATLGADNYPGDGDDTFTSGNITSLRIGGSVTSSIIAAGLDVTDDIFPLDGTETLFAGSRITALTIAGTLSDDSLVLATTEPPKVRVGSTIVITADDPRFSV